MTNLLAMGGYGAYVWSSVGLTFVVIVICLIQARLRHRKIFSDIQKRIRALEAS